MYSNILRAKLIENFTNCLNSIPDKTLEKYRYNIEGLINDLYGSAEIDLDHEPYIEIDLDKE